MNGPAEVFLALIIIGVPMITFGVVFTLWFRLKEKRIELESGLAVEKAAQYAASNAELEALVRVLEKIVTDGGMQTAAQIEALRDLPAPVARLTELQR